MLSYLTIFTGVFMAAAMGFMYGREYECKRRYRPPIGTPGALQEQLHAAMREER